MPLMKDPDQVPSELDVVLMFAPQADAGIEHAQGNLSRKNHLPHDFNQLVLHIGRNKKYIFGPDKFVGFQQDTGLTHIDDLSDPLADF